MRFFDAHCDTITKIVEDGADFALESGGAGSTDLVPLHLTLPELRRAGVCAQVFATWAWRGHYQGRETEAALRMLAATRDLCVAHPEDLVLALTGAQVLEACAGVEERAAADAAQSRRPTAVIASLEGADPLMGAVENLPAFYREGVRLVTVAWGDNEFAGTVFGGGSGLTEKGRDLVGACEGLGIMVDVSHLSDPAFGDVCGVATRPFVASHSNCRSLCPNGRNLTDDMIRALAERGGVMGINLGSSFLSAEFARESEIIRAEFFRSVQSGEKTFDEAGAVSSAAIARIPRPPLATVVDHVRYAIRVGGEDCVGLGGDLDGVTSLPEGLDGVAGYPHIAELLARAGLTPGQLDKVCWRNMARVFAEVVR